MTHHIEQGLNLETALEHEDDPHKRAEIIEEFYAFLHRVPLESLIVQEVA